MPPSVSSIQTEIPPGGISDAKEDLDKAGTELIQFPEGGTAAWCMVVGGYVPLFRTLSDTICYHDRALVQSCGFG